MMSPVYLGDTLVSQAEALRDPLIPRRVAHYQFHAANVRLAALKLER